MIRRHPIVVCVLLLSTPTLFSQSQPDQSSTSSDARINVTAYASSGSGSNDDPWVDALRNALVAKGGGTTYYLPAGFYQDESTLWIQHDDVKIIGDGGNSTIATTILYDETDGSTCWKFAPPADEANKRNYLSGITVKGVCFRGGGKPTGSAIEVEALRRGVFEDISIWRWDGDKKNFSNKGIWTKGWDTITFRNIRVYRVPKCIFLDKNPNFPSIDVDHFHFEDLYLIPGNRDVGVGMEIVAPNVTNLTIDGTNVIAHALIGIHLHNKGTGGNGTNVSLKDIRVESGSRPGSWGIYVDTDHIVNFLVQNVRASGGFNGFYFRGAASLTLMNCFAMGGTAFEETGYVAYDVDAYGDTPLVMINATYNKSPKFGYRDSTTLKVADELQLAVGDGLRVYQNGADVFLKGLSEKLSATDESK